MQKADESLKHADALDILKGWLGSVDWEDDKAVLDYMQVEAEKLNGNLADVRVSAAKKAIATIIEDLTPEAKEDVLKSL